MLIFEHAVKFGGKFYPPNTPIEEPVQKVGKAVQSGAAEEANKESGAKPAPARKAASGRRKGDAK